VRELMVSSRERQAVVMMKANVPWRAQLGQGHPGGPPPKVLQCPSRGTYHWQ
jgi:hypothetical protein